MLRLTKQADYGVVLLVHLANNRTGDAHSARALATHAKIPLPMVSKILKALVRAGMLESHRGVNGGYHMTRPPEEINIAEVICTLEGPIALTDCVNDESGGCAREVSCVCEGIWGQINDIVRKTLEQVSLAEVINSSNYPATFEMVANN